MPNRSTPVPLSNLYSTAPGLEQQLPSPDLRSNFLFPFGYNSNAEELQHGGTPTSELNPTGNISWAAPVGALPLRVTVSGFAESDRFPRASDVDLDKAGGSARLQYVDPSNDQAFSPYVAFAPRWDFLPTFSDQISARQDFNVGINKRFNFDGNFQHVALSGDTSASTVWSFGLTVFAQRRLREPQLSSSAVFVIPSVSYVISEDWNASFAVELLGRWFDTDSTGSGAGLGSVANRDPRICDPDLIFGRRENREHSWAAVVGFPDLPTSRSGRNAPGVSFNQWTASGTMKMGWRF